MRNLYYELYLHEDNIAFSRIISTSMPFTEFKGYIMTRLHISIIGAHKLHLYDYYDNFELGQINAIAKIITNRIKLQNRLVKRNDKGTEHAEAVDRNIDTRRPVGLSVAKEHKRYKRLQRSIKNYTWLDY